MVQKSKNFVESALQRINTSQQRHPTLAFIYAVVRKYSDDQSGQQAALLTYYGFLSLFPLLLVAISIADILAQHNAHLREHLISSFTNYLPVVGQQLQQNIHGKQETGIALVVGLLSALYGGHGVANAVRNALDNAWSVPKKVRSNFQVGLLKALGLFFGVGCGLVLTTILAGYATAYVGHFFLLRIIPFAINAVLLYFIVIYVYVIGTSRQYERKDLRIGAITAVIGLLILQAIGGFLVTHELRRTSGAYGQFALVLTIMFWIYLLAQLFIYSIEVNVVHTFKLWPRSIDNEQKTPADKKTEKLYRDIQA